MTEAKREGSEKTLLSLISQDNLGNSAAKDPSPLLRTDAVWKHDNQRDDGANEIGLDGSGPFPTRHSHAGEHHQHSVSRIGDQP
jgi:hypothetical protein